MAAGQFLMYMSGKSGYQWSSEWRRDVFHVDWIDLINSWKWLFSNQTFQRW